MSAKRHRHEFHALSWTFGEYERQDVHVHSCWRDVFGDGCDRVLVGKGRSCSGVAGDHWRETLTAGSAEVGARAALGEET